MLLLLPPHLHHVLYPPFIILNISRFGHINSSLIVNIDDDFTHFYIPIPNRNHLQLIAIGLDNIIFSKASVNASSKTKNQKKNTTKYSAHEHATCFFNCV